FLSLTCATVSLLVIIALSAVTVLPTPEAETLNGRLMLIAAMCFVAWLGLAYWVRKQQSRPSPSSPLWLTRFLLLIGALYAVSVWFFVFG
ncbi:MAG: hypothetical protein U0984_02670, partial [Prosthecobacter sp.]|nr:hypothetical protein [Prosthecobacter sp.]